MLEYLGVCEKRGKERRPAGSRIIEGGRRRGSVVAGVKGSGGMGEWVYESLA
jgi:hypothetical protein